MGRFTKPELVSFELNEYVQHFKSSTDRVRWVVFVVTVVSLLILLADWNYLHASWSRQRWEDHQLARAAELHRDWLTMRKSKKTPPPSIDESRRYDAMQTPVDEWTAIRVEGDILKAQADQFVSRIVFVPVPVIGASVHVNDLGLAGGVTLVALVGLLALSMAREHENLYLATFKIRRLCERDPAHNNGESPANLPYHALAMVQVFNDPPTLARWNQGSRRFPARATTALLFLLPAIVQCTVVYQNFLSRNKAVAVWGVDVTFWRLTVQATLSLLVLSFSFIAFAYSIACDDRWKQAFFFVNPALRYVEQEPWLEWIRVCRDPFANRRERDVIRQLAQTPEVQSHPHTASTRTPRRKSIDLPRLTLLLIPFHLPFSGRVCHGILPRYHSRSLARVCAWRLAGYCMSWNASRTSCRSRKGVLSPYTLEYIPIVL